jgi:hypothetical protein
MVVVGYEEWKCVAGIRCKGGGNNTRSYEGGVWHDPTNLFPDQTNMYSCMTAGCPDVGAAVMACKAGYSSSHPLCAVCAQDYYYHPRTRECVSCAGEDGSGGGGAARRRRDFVVFALLCAHSIAAVVA